MFTHQKYSSLRTDTARQGLPAAWLGHTGALLLAKRVQAGTGEEAGAWRIDQGAWTEVHVLTALLSAVKPALLAHTVNGEGALSKSKLTSTDTIYF